MSIPAANGVLTAITAGGTADDYDASATPGAARWNGEHGVYVVDELVQDTTPGSVTEVRRTSIVIDAALGRTVQRGDTLTYRYQNAAHTRRVRDIRVTEIAGTARVALEDA